jgi:cytolethal distending toxin subunit A
MKKINTPIRSVAVFRRARQLLLTGATTILIVPGMLAASPTQAAAAPAARIVSGAYVTADAEQAPPSANAARGPRSGGTYQIQNLNSRRCLTIAGGSTNDNDRAVQYNCDTHPSRRWTLTDVTGTGNYQIQNLNSRRCLTIAGGSTNDNDPAVQYNCDTHPSRRWTLTAVG